MNCTWHFNHQVSLICIASHQCQQRKLCIECLYNHGVDLKQTVPIDKFEETLVKKKKESKLDEQSKLLDQRKSILSKIETIIKEIQEGLAKTIKQIYDMIELENQKYINLLYGNLNLAQSSNTELENLVQIFHNKLDLRSAEKNQYIAKLDNLENQLNLVAEAFNEKIKKEMNQFNLIDFFSKMFEEVESFINSKTNEQVQHTQQPLIQSFKYEIIKDKSIKEEKRCRVFTVSKDGSIVAIGCNKHIKLYQFNQGIMKQTHILKAHKNNVNTLNFIQKSNQLISGDDAGSIVIWQSNNNSQWNPLETIKIHNDYISCLILDNWENFFVSCSYDTTIKFWIKQNQWICQQTIPDHTSKVYQISINDQQDKVISCGKDNEIFVIEYSQQSKIWMLIQKIKVDCYGKRLCFINNNLFTFQPCNSNLMHVYEMNKVSREFAKTQNITINQGKDNFSFFPQQFIKQKQILVNKHSKYVYFLRKTEKDGFKVEQSIPFKTDELFGQLSDDGEYFISWDISSKVIQIRKYMEE
ncbi:unnamed protein product [Paramecium sonneborni]|uniref:Uncharacterized protein n=1 Tax=Paramecium sonneborni TaxID=65129 RepID=A0A8S1RQX3_9CILI|nr:unnamed protein product [Paramecium sonneborni]